MTSEVEFRRIVDYTDLEELLQCPLCLDRFDQPRLIPCGHTYCTKCLNELCSDNDKLICPQCQKQHDVPIGGITQFSWNVSYQQLLDIRTEQLVSTRQCQICDSKHAFSDCLHCRKAVCHDCKQLHEIEFSTITNLLLTDLRKSIDLYKDTSTMQITALLTNRDTVKEEISMYTKELIDLIKQQEKQLKNDLDKIVTQQMESLKKVFKQFERNENDIKNFIQLSKQTELILDEKYMGIQNTARKHLITIQNVMTMVKNKREEIIFIPSRSCRVDHLGKLHLSVSIDQTDSLSLIVDNTHQQPIRQIGQRGNGPLEFQCPSGLVITHDNKHLIVVDSCNHRLQMLTIDGHFIRSTSGINGHGFSELNNPRDVCINSTNEWIIISDSDNHRLVIYDINNLHVQRLIENNDSEISFHFPLGICCDKDDLLYVCDRGNNRIVVIRFNDGIFINQWGRKGIEYGEFDAPDYICCRENILAVSDFNNHRVQVFTLQGQFLFSFGKFGSGNKTEFRYPRGISIDHEGFFMVADWMNNRLQLFTPNGTLSAIITDKNSNENLSIPKIAFNRPIGLTISNQGIIFITEWGRSHRIVIY